MRRSWLGLEEDMMFTWLNMKTSTLTLNLQTMDSRLPREFQSLLAGSGVPGFRQALPRLAAEFDRARRYQHALTIALFGEDGVLASGASTAGWNGGDGASVTRAHALPPDGHGLFPAVLASVLREGTRDADIVTYAAALGRCIVVMPETDRAQAHQAVNRLRELGTRRLMFPVRASIATFPEDGWTIGELIRQAGQDGPRPPEEVSRSTARTESSLNVRSA